MKVEDYPMQTYDDLSIEERFLVLTWMRDSIHSGMQKQIMANSYRAFVHALHTGEKFEPDQVWATLPQTTRQHFGHAAEILAQLDSDIEFCEDTLEQQEDEIQDDPFAVDDQADKVDDQADEEPQ
jgi:hypothetical protein